MPNILQNHGYSYSVAAFHIIGFVYCIFILGCTIRDYYLEDQLEDAAATQINSASSTPNITPVLPTPSTRTPSFDNEPELNHQSTVLIKSDQQIDDLFRKKPISLRPNSGPDAEIQMELFEQQQSIYTMASISLLSLSLLFCSLFNIPFDASVDPERHSIFNVLTRCSWTSGQILCLWTLIYRLNTVFIDTPYRIPSKYLQYFVASTVMFAAGELILSTTIVLRVTAIITLDEFVVIAMLESIVVKVPSSLVLSLCTAMTIRRTVSQISLDTDYGRSSFDSSHLSSTLGNWQQAMTFFAAELSVYLCWCLLSMNIAVMMWVLVHILWTIVGAAHLYDIAAVVWMDNFVWMISVIINVSCLYLNLPTTAIQVYMRCCGQCDRVALEFGKHKIEELHEKVHADYLRMTDSAK